MNTAKKIGIGLACIIVLSFAAGVLWWIVADEERGSVRIGYLPIAGDLPVFVAQEFSYFREQGLEVELVELASGNEAVAALLSGKTDMQATLGVTTLLPLLEKSPGEVIVIFSAIEAKGTQSSGIVSRPGSGITKIEHMKGKKVGTYTGLTQLQTLKLILDKYMDPGIDIEILQVEPRLQVQALAAGQFDALFSIEPYISLALAEANASIIEWNAREKEIVSPFWAAGTVVSRRFTERRPRDVEKLIRSLEKAALKIQRDEAASRKILEKYTPLREPITSGVGLYMWLPVGKEDRDAFRRLAVLLQQAGVTKAVAEPSDIFYE